MEIAVLNTKESLEIKDFEALKAELTEKVGVYAKIVYTDDTIKTAKKDRAALNKLSKAIADKRKEEKDNILERYRKFEDECKQLESLVNDASGNIDKQVKEYEEGIKKSKKEELFAYFETLNSDCDFEKIFKTQWLNTTVSVETAKKEIDSLVNAYISNLEALKTVPFAFEAQDCYRRTLNMSEALQESKRMQELQKRKEEQEKADREKWLESLRHKTEVVPDKSEIEGQTEIKTSDVAPVEEETKAAESKEEVKSWINFSALLSARTAKLLKAFLFENDIEIKRI